MHLSKQQNLQFMVFDHLLIVFDGIGMDSLWVQMHIGRIGYGQALGLERFGPKAGLDGPDCRDKALLALLGRDRLVVAAVKSDIHTWLRHVCNKIERKWQSVAFHTGRHLYIHNILGTTRNHGQQTQPT